MRIAITQPTYLPWLGYFDLLDVLSPCGCEDRFRGRQGLDAEALQAARA